MFVDSSHYQFLKPLQSGWRKAFQEIISLKSNYFAQWPERDIYSGKWTVFGLYNFGEKISENCALCPQTTKLVESVPGMVSAGFSSMAPGTHITPHKGYTSQVLRCHLGLVTNDDCALRVGAQERGWTPGSCFVFDDTVEHEAWNRGATTRIVLIVDFKRDQGETVIAPEHVRKYRV
ncbi:aspartyl/asparaginyl beta-hydroxylase domain-containing protein [Pseudorhodoferax sp. Leaf274]|uniref:aspartyl/asparaginyl beta-hydroxylase domain-containing protein n=1 Tax=Pseudorhodoferax sp. Leaf274 TaxID=1736318 RepID=UPI0009E9229C|nr:aspartyl/asparaginyl beta-hydroxylase domain-containing protein [Pseudorhodoferax sp. Leaf274]